MQLERLARVVGLLASLIWVHAFWVFFGVYLSWLAEILNQEDDGSREVTESTIEST